jgi:hypothetical protein
MKMESYKEENIVSWSGKMRFSIHLPKMNIICRRWIPKKCFLGVGPGVLKSKCSFIYVLWMVLNFKAPVFEKAAANFHCIPFFRAQISNIIMGLPIPMFCARSSGTRDDLWEMSSAEFVWEVHLLCQICVESLHAPYKRIRFFFGPKICTKNDIRWVLGWNLQILTCLSRNLYGRYP